MCAARASPSQPGPARASQGQAQPAASQAGRQPPGKTQPGTRKKREVAESQSHMAVWRHLVTWASSSFCLTLFSPPPRLPERTRTLAVYGQSDNRANSGEPLRKRTPHCCRARRSVSRAGRLFFFCGRAYILRCPYRSSLPSQNSLLSPRVIKSTELLGSLFAT